VVLRGIECVEIRIFRDGQLVTTIHTDEKGKASVILEQGYYRFEYWKDNKKLGETYKLIHRRANIHFHQWMKFPPPPEVSLVLAPFLTFQVEKFGFKTLEISCVGESIPLFESISPISVELSCIGDTILSWETLAPPSIDVSCLADSILSVETIAPVTAELVSSASITLTTETFIA